MRTIQRQSRRSRRASLGFTLTETLIAVAVLVIITAVLAGVLPIALRAYRDTVDGANAQLLLSTTMTALRNELSEASGIEASAGGSASVLYENRRGCRTVLSNSADGICLHEYPDPAEQPDGIERLLVSKEAATSRLHAEFETIRYDRSSGLVTVSQIVIKNREGRVLDGPQDLVIRTGSVNP